jgi:hypothetical protein
VEPDTKIIAVLQDQSNGSIIEKCMNLSAYGSLNTAINRAKQGNKNYVLLYIHSYKEDKSTNGED